MRKGIELIQACKCTAPTGCPGCIQHTTCNQYNAVLNKEAGIIVLQVMIFHCHHGRGIRIRI